MLEGSRNYLLGKIWSILMIVFVVSGTLSIDDGQGQHYTYNIGLILMHTVLIPCNLSYTKLHQREKLLHSYVLG